MGNLSACYVWVFLLCVVASACADGVTGAELELGQESKLPSLPDPSTNPSLDPQAPGSPSDAPTPAPVPVCQANELPEYKPQQPGACEDVNGTIKGRLPGTGVEYCLKAHPDCAQAGASCPLFVMSNLGAAYMDYVEQPAKYGRIVVAQSYGPRDGQEVKDWVAELPRALMSQYQGIDPERIYFIGWSAGAGAATRGLCQSSKGWDQSTYGTTSDLYAAMVTLGGCPGCSADFKPKAGSWHVLAVNGQDDPFGGQGCEERLRALASTSGCDAPSGWQNVGEQDPYVSGGDGSDIAQRLGFEGCQRGAALGYRFKDEAHVLSFKKNFDPRVRALEITWRFLQGRLKRGGSQALEPVCR